MNVDPALRPTGASDQDPGREAPHLADYWQVVSRRIWLVLLIFGVTAVSSMWAVSKQTIYFQATLSLQVNDPFERTRSLTPGARLAGGNVFVDPIQSELEVLRSGTIAGEVVDLLGLRLVPADEGIVQSALVREVRIDREVPDGTYRIVYDASGQNVELRDAVGNTLGSAAVGSPLEAGGIHFIPRLAPLEQRAYTVNLLPREQMIPLVRQNISAAPRPNTNIIDVTYISEDPLLAPEILNGIARALREYGERRVIATASREVQFIEDRLDSARVQLSGSLQAIRAFKESQDFTNLSAQEQRLVNQSQELGVRIEAQEGQRSTLAGTVRKIERGGLTESDLVQLTAELGQDGSAQLRELISRVQSGQQGLRVLLGSGITADHPEARGLRAQIQEAESELLDAIQATLRVVENRLETLNRQQAEVLARQREFPQLENRLQTLEVQQVTDMGTYEFLLAQVQQARITEAAAAPYVDVIDPAVGSSPVQPRGRINVFLGSLMGLLLGVGAAFFLEYLDRTVRTSSDVETLLGLPAIGVIPRMRRVIDGGEAADDGGGRRNLPLVVALDPLDPAAEAYRNLRMNLMFMNTAERPIRSIIVSSPGPNEGKSTTAVNLAVMLAQQGEKVLLLDADLRRPALHRTMDLLREPGLSNLLVGDVELREAIRPNVLPNLDFLPAGIFPPNPSELLTSKMMRRLVDDCEERYAFVIIDSPPILAVTDSALLSAYADGVLLVLRSAGTEERAAERAVEQLARIGVTIFGVVLNEVASRTTEESYYLRYHHSYHPHEESKWQKMRRALDSKLDKVKSRS